MEDLLGPWRQTNAYCFTLTLKLSEIQVYGEEWGIHGSKSASHNSVETCTVIRVPGELELKLV
jgi:hypothetical protein